MQSKINHIELAWAAGFFDGEGCVSGRGNRKGLPQIAITQHESPDCLLRFKKAVLNRGRVYGPRWDKRGRGPIYVYNASTFENAQFIVALLWKYLSEPKRECAQEIFLDYHLMRYHSKKGI